MEKKYVKLTLTPYTKLNQNRSCFWCETMKLLEENTGEIHHDLRLGQEIIDVKQNHNP